MQCSDGGLGVALSESAFSGDLGMTIELTKVPVDNIKRADTPYFAHNFIIIRFFLPIHNGHDHDI
jgi:phosphoribosylformylglycinamidine (FGAM) synthase-like enzyme